MEHDDFQCEDIILEDETKKCILIKDKCIEQYKTCEDYKLNVKAEICESILPVNGVGNYFYYTETSKCVYEEGKCITKKRHCSDLEEMIKDEDTTTSELCESLYPKDPNKICSMQGNQCIETYEECEDYNENVKQDICESIITSYSFNECVFEDGECISKEKTCSEYNVDFLQVFCSDIIPFNFNKKCSLSNGICSEKDKICSDYTYGATEDICNNVLTSDSSKKCVFKEDKNRCEEINKNNEERKDQNKFEASGKGSILKFGIGLIIYCILNLF